MYNETFNTSKNISDIKIALLSDIHYYPKYNTKILDRLLKQIKTNKPDYLCIAGDILDFTNVTDYSKLINWLKKITSICPILMVLGNHDEKDGHIKKWAHKKNNEFIQTIKSINNLYLLDNETKTFNNISFYGFQLSYKHYEIDNEKYSSFCNEVKNLNPKFTKDKYNIILFHSPINIYNYIKNNPQHPFNECDLILSGHMHNGCLPYIISHPINKIFKTSRSIISPLRKLFPDFSHGRVYNKIKDGYIYEGVNKLSKSTKLLHKLDFIYSKNVQFITIKKH